MYCKLEVLIYPNQYSFSVPAYCKLLSFIDPELRGFGQIFPEVMIFPEGLIFGGVMKLRV